MGFFILADASSDGTLAVEGSFALGDGAAMGGRNFELIGKFLQVVPSTLFDSGAGPNEGELIMNGSFENTEGTFVGDGFGLMPLPLDSGAIPGWTTATAELAWVDDANTLSAATPFGTHSLDLTGYHDSLPYGGISQTIATTAGKNYRLSFALGSQEDNAAYRGKKNLTVSIDSRSQSFTFAPSGEGSQWGIFTLYFNADSTATALAFHGSDSIGGAYLGLDNISVVHVAEIPRAAILRVSPSEMTVRFPVEPGGTYAVETREDLALGEWLTVPDTIHSSTGASLEVSLPFSASEPQRYYRLLQLR